MPATGEDLAAVHASEIAYLFGNLGYAKGISWQPEDWRLSDQMGTYLTNFAKTGNPNGEGLPPWPRYDQGDGYQVMHLNTVTLSAPETHRDRYEFWDSK
jgi:para-nitrobenzyl esterase